MATKKKHAEPKPVTVTVQPVTPCKQCGHPVTYPRQAGAAAAALTEHYNRAHPAAA